jgi:hypothetical protein
VLYRLQPLCHVLGINRLWNFDKHRAPFALGCVPDMASYALFDDGTDFPQIRVHMGTVLEEGKEIAWIPFNPRLKDDFKPHFHFSVAFVVGTAKRPIPHYGLTKMYDIITNEVVPVMSRAI